MRRVPAPRAEDLDDEVDGGQVLVVLGDDDQGSATGIALSGHFLNLAPNCHSAPVAVRGAVWGALLSAARPEGERERRVVANGFGIATVLAQF